MQRILSFMMLGLTAMGGAKAQSPFQVNHDATQISCNCYQLTEEATNQHGSVWNLNQLDLTQPFDMSFRVYLGDLNGWGADGMSFVLQQGTNSTSEPHGNPGHQFISPSIAVEIDQFMETENTDPGDDHVAIMANGSYDHASPENLAGPVDAIFLGENIDDGDEHVLRIIWDPTDFNLRVHVDFMLLPLLSYTGDIVTNIFGGDPMVYWGFTGGTGGIPSEHRFCFDLGSNITASSTTICPGGEIAFSSTASSSLSPIQSWHWDFGNDSISVQADPTMVFELAGNYTVTQTISDISGCESVNTIAVTVQSPPNAEVELESSCTAQNLGLINLTTGAQTYEWTFSDGQTSMAQTPDITMTETGPQSLQLIAASSAGCTDTTTLEFTIGPSPSVVLTVEDHCLGETVPYSLDLSGSVAVIDSVHWNMDDGTDYTISSISHEYESSGTYSIEFVAISDMGCATVVTQDVQVFGEMPEVAENSDTLSVINGPYVSYQWFLNGVLIPGATAFSYVPVTSGNISVVATDANGCEISSFNIEFTTTIGIEDRDQPFEVNLLPNPNAGVFVLSARFDQVTESLILITDVLGRDVIQPIANAEGVLLQRTFDLSSIESGTYHLTVINALGRVTLPFVVAK